MMNIKVYLSIALQATAFLFTVCRELGRTGAAAAAGQVQQNVYCGS